MILKTLQIFLINIFLPNFLKKAPMRLILSSIMIHSSILPLMRLPSNLLKQTNPNKSQGPDNICGYLLKNCAHFISSPLVIIFNISFRTGSIPNEWKTANIVPIHKKRRQKLH